MRFKSNLVCVVVVDVVVVSLVEAVAGVGVAGQTVAAASLHWGRRHVEAALPLTGLEHLLAGVVVHLTLAGQLLGLVE